MKRLGIGLSCLFLVGSLVSSGQQNGGNEVITVMNADRFDQGDYALYYGAATLENQRGSNGKALYPNQDRVFLCALLGRIAVVLCDGHGKDGDHVAEKVSSLLPIEVCKYKDITYGFETGIAKIQKALFNQKYAQESGATCVAGVINGNVLTIANVGDSRLLVTQECDLTGTHSLLYATVDHKPTEPQEITRIKNAGGVIANGYVYNKSGHGLALTRSLGDVAAHDNDVITAQPDITEVTLSDGSYIIVASDGFWDVVTNKEVVALATKASLHTGNNACTQFAQELVALARSRKSKDDITVMVMQYCKNWNSIYTK